MNLGSVIPNTQQTPVLFSSTSLENHKAMTSDVMAETGYLVSCHASQTWETTVTNYPEGQDLVSDLWLFLRLTVTKVWHHGGAN